MTTVAVAIQGEAGSFSHAAALQALGPDIRLVPCPTFEELFGAVEKGDAARGAVPIENSLAGSVHENLRSPTRTAPRRGGKQVRVRHCLQWRAPGTERAGSRRVASHPGRAGRVRRFFAGNTLKSCRSRPTIRRAASGPDGGSGRPPTPPSGLRSPPSCTGPRSCRKASRTIRNYTRFCWWRATPLRPSRPERRRSPHAPQRPGLASPALRRVRGAAEST